MLSHRRKMDKQGKAEYDEYQQKYKEDLMVRLSQRNQREMVDRRNQIAKRQDFKELAASKSPETKAPIQFVQKLTDMENIDHLKAKAITDAQEAEDQRLEDLDIETRNQKLKVIQLENFNKLAIKQSQGAKEKRDENVRDGAFYASVTLQDLVNHKDPTLIKNLKAQTMNGFLSEQLQQRKQTKKEGDGKFFGMTDEEILLNKETFVQMGLI